MFSNYFLKISVVYETTRKIIVQEATNDNTTLARCMLDT